MRLDLRPFRPEDRAAVVAMRLGPGQERFVAPNDVSLVQAAEHLEAEPLLVEADGVPVGFVLVCRDPEDGDWWLWRFMLDGAHQGRGLGAGALGLVMRHLAAKPDCARVRLGVVPDNAAALRLYAKAGFVPTGEVEGGETIMRWERPGAP